jgi:hypothetical protein
MYAHASRLLKGADAFSDDFLYYLGFCQRAVDIDLNEAKLAFIGGHDTGWRDWGNMPESQIAAIEVCQWGTGITPVNRHHERGEPEDEDCISTHHIAVRSAAYGVLTNDGDDGKIDLLPHHLHAFHAAVTDVAHGSLVRAEQIERYQLEWERKWSKHYDEIEDGERAKARDLCISSGPTKCLHDWN